LQDRAHQCWDLMTLSVMQFMARLLFIMPHIRVPGLTTCYSARQHGLHSPHRWLPRALHVSPNVSFVSVNKRLACTC
jgi:hypothetical protein